MGSVWGIFGWWGVFIKSKPKSLYQNQEKRSCRTFLMIEVVLLSRPRFFTLFMIDILFSKDQPKLFMITLFRFLLQSFYWSHQNFSIALSKFFSAPIFPRSCTPFEDLYDFNFFLWHFQKIFYQNQKIHNHTHLHPLTPTYTHTHLHPLKTL